MGTGPPSVCLSVCLSDWTAVWHCDIVGFFGFFCLFFLQNGGSMTHGGSLSISGILDNHSIWGVGQAALSLAHHSSFVPSIHPCPLHPSIYPEGALKMTLCPVLRGGGGLYCRTCATRQTLGVFFPFFPAAPAPTPPRRPFCCSLPLPLAWRLI